MQPQCPRMQRTKMLDLYVYCPDWARRARRSRVITSPVHHPVILASDPVRMPRPSTNVAHLKQGTRSSKKITNINDVKIYLSVATIEKDGLLVVRRCTRPLSPSTDLILVPRSVVDGFVSALHIKLDHSSKHRLLLLMKRHFNALDMPTVVDRVCETCHTYASSRKLPEPLMKQTTENPPDT
jgi:hypothetical protein